MKAKFFDSIKQALIKKRKEEPEEQMEPTEQVKPLNAGKARPARKVVLYTPREIVSGFISPPAGVNVHEAVWHAGAIALETERIRFVSMEADGGVYFIASDASDFVGHPDSATTLSAAFPGSEGYQGDGAYHTDLGLGIVAVVLKGKRSLQCYVGERADVVRFVGDAPIFWPTLSSEWVGFRHLEAGRVLRLSKYYIAASFLISGIFLGVAFWMNWKAGQNEGKKEVSLENLQAEQQKAAGALNVPNTNAFIPYRNLVSSIIQKNGLLTKVDVDEKGVRFEANFLPGMADTRDFGIGAKATVSNGKMIISKGY